MEDSQREGLVRLTHLIYGLHAFSAVMGVISSAAVVTAFLTGWPSILAVILNYARRDAVRGSYLESHFAWQIRTFWFAVLWVVVAAFLFVTVIGIPFAWLMVVVTGIWAHSPDELELLAEGPLSDTRRGGPNGSFLR